MEFPNDLEAAKPVVKPAAAKEVKPAATAKPAKPKHHFKPAPDSCCVAFFKKLISRWFPLYAVETHTDQGHNLRQAL